MYIFTNGNIASDANLKTADAKKLCNQKEFWGQVYLAWCEYNYHEPQCLDEVLNEILWMNSHIKLLGKPLFWRKCIDCNFIYVRDLYDKNSATGILSYQELCLKYGSCISWLEYENLKGAFPTIWKLFLQQDISTGDTPQSNFDKLQGLKVSKTVYHELITSDKTLVKYASRWICRSPNNTGHYVLSKVL